MEYATAIEVYSSQKRVFATQIHEKHEFDLRINYGTHIASWNSMHAEDVTPLLEDTLNSLQKDQRAEFASVKETLVPTLETLHATLRYRPNTMVKVHTIAVA